jgi:hypothetical protein
MISHRGLTWLALATLLASGCDKTLSFDPPVEEGNGGEPGSGGVSGSGGGGGSAGSDEPWQRAGGPSTDPPSTGGTGFTSDEACVTFCAQEGQRCDETDRRCVECFDHHDCPEDRFCDRGLNRCVICVSNEGCPDGKRCDDQSNQCFEPCLTAEHPDDTCHDSTKMCDEERERCVACRGDADCAGSPEAPYCLATGTRCVECEGDFQCGKGRVCDQVLFRCVECEDSRDCVFPMLCHPESHTCYDSRYTVPFPT